MNLWFKIGPRSFRWEEDGLSGNFNASDKLKHPFSRKMCRGLSSPGTSAIWYVLRSTDESVINDIDICRTIPGWPFFPHRSRMPCYGNQWFLPFKCWLANLVLTSLISALVMAKIYWKHELSQNLLDCPFLRLSDYSKWDWMGPFETNGISSEQKKSKITLGSFLKL